MRRRTAAPGDSVPVAPTAGEGTGSAAPAQESAGEPAGRALTPLSCRGLSGQLSDQHRAHWTTGLLLRC